MLLQLVYPGRILRLRVRGTNRDITEDTSSFEEVCVVIPGIIARFDGSDIQVCHIIFQRSTTVFLIPRVVAGLNQYLGLKCNL